ncbi:MAG: hypothetical protein COX70_01870 [Flavobacteriales bacterium CG_4_10_14_0_2_um_filter_32_8]|nr:MAG: hypothetical protein AUJ97_06245 [Bacteroidetes bacterium CG2_30_32_10]PJA09402.1 MAG: hypothetical protein COX70_01870 [Flavobacteriales bacterium CG_4_10_14_0_2_um_filter_32_8]PJB16108.1 MAG: hypothetical protein CO118_01010 [Flavobacteriales bacterium CG_4_9_14_3_um_filter_32_8]
MGLKDKLQKLSKTETTKKIDLEKVISEWQTEVEKTLKETLDWLKPYLEQGLLKAVEKEKTIKEEILGEYTIKQLEYEFGKFRLVFEPMGRNILGAWGRIDVYLRGSKTDKYVLVLLGENFKISKWYLSSFQDKSKRTEFNKKNLEKLIEEWIDKNTF